MIYLSKETESKLNRLDENSVHVLTDFDRTITAGNSKTSWAILAESNLMPKEYAEDRQKLFDYYRPIEIDETLDYQAKNKLMIKWWKEHVKLFVKYRLSENIIAQASGNYRVIQFREGAADFLKTLHEKNIPVIIISAGIGNFILEFLIRNGCNYENIFVISNFIEFKNGIAVGINENIIHSLNKNETSVPGHIKIKMQDRPDIILLGDAIGDTRMVSDELRDSAVKIGFSRRKN